MASSVPLFGVSFTRSFSVADDVGEQSGLQLVAARLFSEVPDDATVLDDTVVTGFGFVERVTSWSAGEAANEKLITYSAITDPDPLSISHETYYEVLNYQLQSGGPELYEIRPFTLKRPSSLQGRLFCSVEDITDVEYKVGQVRSDTQILTAIAECEDQFIFRLRRNRWERHRVMEGDYNRAFKLFCLARICLSLSDKPGDIWWMKCYGDPPKILGYMGEYEEAFSNDPIHEDVDDDGNLTDAEIQTSSVVYFNR